MRISDKPYLADMVGTPDIKNTRENNPRNSLCSLQIAAHQVVVSLWFMNKVCTNYIKVPEYSLPDFAELCVLICLTPPVADPCPVFFPNPLNSLVAFGQILCSLSKDFCTDLVQGLLEPSETGTISKAWKGRKEIFLLKYHFSILLNSLESYCLSGSTSHWEKNMVPTQPNNSVIMF